VICGVHFPIKIVETLNEALMLGKQESETFVTGNVVKLLVGQR
jgi:hypothetical protein